MNTTTQPARTVTLPAGLDLSEIAAALDEHARALTTAATTAALQLPSDHNSARVPALNLARQVAHAERLRLAARAINDAPQPTS